MLGQSWPWSLCVDLGSKSVLEESHFPFRVTGLS